MRRSASTGPAGGEYSIERRRRLRRRTPPATIGACRRPSPARSRCRRPRSRGPPPSVPRSGPAARPPGRLCGPRRMGRPEALGAIHDPRACGAAGAPLAPVLSRVGRSAARAASLRRAQARARDRPEQLHSGRRRRRRAHDARRSQPGGQGGDHGHVRRRHRAGSRAGPSTGIRPGRGRLRAASREHDARRARGSRALAEHRPGAAHAALGARPSIRSAGVGERVGEPGDHRVARLRGARDAGAVRARGCQRSRRLLLETTRHHRRGGWLRQVRRARSRGRQGGLARREGPGGQATSPRARVRPLDLARRHDAPAARPQAASGRPAPGARSGCRAPHLTGRQPAIPASRRRASVDETRRSCLPRRSCRPRRASTDAGTITRCRR